LAHCSFRSFPQSSIESSLRSSRQTSFESSVRSSAQSSHQSTVHSSVQTPFLTSSESSPGGSPSSTGWAAELWSSESAHTICSSCV
jgi:hypothetical protein